MREQKMHLVITFHNTTEAIALEHRFKQDGLPGRLIPVPSSIRAGCGLAWIAPIETAELIIFHIRQTGIDYEAIWNLAKGIYS